MGEEGDGLFGSRILHFLLLYIPVKEEKNAGRALSPNAFYFTEGTVKKREETSEELSFFTANIRQNEESREIKTQYLQGFEDFSRSKK